MDENPERSSERSRPIAAYGYPARLLRKAANYWRLTPRFALLRRTRHLTPSKW
jgi:hypothetical protein